MPWHFLGVKEEKGNEKTMSINCSHLHMSSHYTCRASLVSSNGFQNYPDSCSRLWLSTNSSQIPNKGSPPFTEFLLRLILPSRGCMCVLSRKGKGIVNCEGSTKPPKAMYMKLRNRCSILQKHWGYHSFSSCCSYKPTAKAARINS